jgi:hypothetical protein
MAHPARKNVPTSFGPKIVLQRPKLASLLGCVASEWSLLEQDVIFLYAILMGRYLPTFEGCSLPLHPVGLQIFDAIETTHTRMELLRKLSSYVLRESSFVSDVEGTVIPSIRKAAKQRNKLVHGNWGISGEYPDSLIYSPVFGDKLVYEERDFDEAIAEIGNARNLLIELRVKIEKYFRDEPRWHGPSPFSDDATT